MTRAESFAAIAVEFSARVHKAVWCNAVRVDARGWPRSRVLRTIWEGHTGWIAPGRQSSEMRQIARQPHVSLANVADPSKPADGDCIATWQDDRAAKRRL